MRVACQYAIVRFLPFLETGEFANVGVVLFSPKTGFWDFKLADATFPRVTKFFGELDRQVYRQAIKGFSEELKEVQLLAAEKRGEDLLVFAKEITRYRESLLRFSELRSVLVSDPQVALDDIYDRFVDRNFVNKDYGEASMAKAIKRQLANFNLERQYVTHTFEADFRRVKFPLVNRLDNASKVMKPLDFNQRTASALIEHGESWKNKIQWLLDRNKLAEDKILLPIEAPKAQGEDFTEAYNIVVKDFESLNVELVSFSNSERIVEFAREDQPLSQLH